MKDYRKCYNQLSKVNLKSYISKAKKLRKTNSTHNVYDVNKNKTENPSNN